MIGWLPAVALYWTLAALYLGGAAIDIEGGAGRQVGGLFLHFVVFVAVFGVTRILLQGMVGFPLGVALGLVVFSRYSQCRYATDCPESILL